MVEHSVMPFLSRRAAEGTRGVIESRVLRLCGIGESAAEDKIKDLLGSQNPTIAPLARSGEVHLRITAKATDVPQAEQMIAELESKARERLDDYVYGVDDETLESVVVRMLIERKLKLAVAESCTGGLVSHRVTNVPGSSRTFIAGIVAYANEAKSRFLGVPEDLLRERGAVSAEVAEAMAEGAASSVGADVALGITGIAGPSGGTPQKPVGLVFVGLKTPDGLRSMRSVFGGGRLEIKQRTSVAALNLLRMYLVDHG